MMTHGQRYQIGTPTIAVITDAGRRIATTIPRGDIVEFADSPIQGEGLIHARWNGQIVEMFIQDVMERGHQVKSMRGSSH